MESVEVLVAATSDRSMNGNSSSSLGNGGSHQTSDIVTNGHFKEEEIIHTKVNRTVQFAKDEAVLATVEPPSLADSVVVVDKIVEVNGIDLEGDGKTLNGTVEDNNNNSVLKGNGGRRHKQLGIEGDESDDEDVEEVELEFENVIPKLHDHNAYCPNCDAQITKVILRRRIPKKILITPSVKTTVTHQHPKEEEERELVGCLSCFSIFMPKGNTLHPFPIFGADDTNVTEASSQQFQSLPKSTPKEIGCDPFAMFRSKGESGDVKKANKLPQPLMEETPSLQITYGGVGDSISNVKRHYGYETLPLPTVNSGDMSITIRDIPLPGTSGLSTTLLPITEVQSNSPEIVKSIVYGGLAESITSLGLVSSAAASGASTLNIVALGLANLIGGLFVLAQSLANLKNDQQEEKYKEALGPKERFFQHATIAMISYLVFGLVPPIVYGFTFRDTDNKDFKLIAVAVASLICIMFLAIGKAYIAQAQQFHKFSTYFNYVVYYVATAAMASGVGYVVGDQAKKILDKYGWLLPKDQPTNTLFLQGSQTLKPSFASF